MDPNPNSHPILSYVLSRLPPSLSFKLASKSSPSPSFSHNIVDIEQPKISAQTSADPELDLSERMPGLKDPSILAEMSKAVSDVAQTRSILRTLGDRPDHEAVDYAKARLSLIESDQVDLNLSKEEMEKELIAYRSVIQLDDMHESYETLLKEAEERLESIYRAAMESAGAAGNGEDRGLEEEEVNEEVIGILEKGKFMDRVDLSGCGLKHLPEAFGRMSGLVSLNVSDNQLEILPDAIGALELLEELRASGNELTVLPDSIGLLSNLKVLIVSNNKLKALPDSISHCRSLVELDASYNQLSYLPTNIGYKLTNLQSLRVHLNKLRSLPTSLCEMTSLRLLDAHFNELRGLPPAIGKLTNLETLNVSSNFSDLQELPASFGELVNLKELDLSNNQIRYLPDSFGRLEKLEKINLDQNPLVVPPMEVVSGGVEAVKEYMSERWLEILLEAERSEAEEESEQAEAQAQSGWLTRSVSSLNSWVSGVSESVAEYLTPRARANRDSFLDEQR